MKLKTNKRKKKIIIVSIVSAAAAVCAGAVIAVSCLPDYVMGKHPVIALTDSTVNFAGEFRSVSSGYFEYEVAVNSEESKKYEGRYIIDREKKEILIGAELREQINDFNGHEYYAAVIGQKSGRYVVKDFKEEISEHSFSSDDLPFDNDIMWNLIEGSEIRPDKMIETVDKNKIVTGIISEKKIRSIWNKFIVELAREENQTALEEAMNITRSDGVFHSSADTESFKRSLSVILDIADDAGSGKINNLTMSLLKGSVKYADKLLPDNFGYETEWDYRHRKLTKFSYHMNHDGSYGEYNMKYTFGGKKLKSFSGEYMKPETGICSFRMTKFNKVRDPYKDFPSDLIEIFRSSENKGS